MKFNVYYVTQGILLFIFSRYSSYVWLTDGRSLIKTKESRLIIIVCFRVRSITKKAKHRNYSVKVHGGKYKAWYMTTIWKIRYKFADAKINWLTGWCYSSTVLHVVVLHVTIPLIFYIVKAIIYFLSFCLTDNIIFLHYFTWLVFKFVGEELSVIFLDHFVLVLLSKLTYFLSSCSLCTHLCDKLFTTYNVFIK